MTPIAFTLIDGQLKYGTEKGLGNGYPCTPDNKPGFTEIREPNGQTWVLLKIKGEAWPNHTITDGDGVTTTYTSFHDFQDGLESGGFGL